METDKNNTIDIIMKSKRETFRNEIRKKKISHIIDKKRLKIVSSSSENIKKEKIVLNF